MKTLLIPACAGVALSAVLSTTNLPATTIAVSWPHPPKIKMKTPKLTIGKMKLEVPTPATIIKNVATATAVATQQVGAATAVAAQQVGAATAVAAQQVGTATVVATQQVGAAAGVAAGQSERALRNTVKAVGQGGHDLVLETGRIPGHFVDVGDAFVAYGNSLGTSAVEVAADTERRLRQGKIADAFFHVALAPLTAEQEAAFRATQESGWVNAAGAVAATAYGGPAGSAAYAAWQTYHLTNNNLELALRAGIIAGLTSAANGAVSKLDGSLVSEKIRNTVLAGAISGASIAASGGDDNAIRNGILLGGGMVLVQDAYQDYVGHPLDARGATGPAYCMSAADPTCDQLRAAYTYDEATKKWEYDPSKLDPRMSHVGIQAQVGTPANPLNPGDKITWDLDRSPNMQVAARVPVFNAMGLFHDKWAFDWNMGAAATVGTILPAVAITYIGTEAPLLQAITEQVVAQQPTPAGPNTAPTLPAAPQPAEQALHTYTTKLTEQTDSITAATPGLEHLGEGILKPAAGWVWANPKNAQEFEVHPIDGLEKASASSLRPAMGWEWAKPEDPLSMDVRRIEGLVATAQGKFQPMPGWEWANPKDPNSLAVVAVKK